MKKNILLFFALIQLVLNAQSGEFKTYSNGLIYSENTMGKLTSIVDSLNLKFKSCDLERTYLSKKQAIGNYFELEDGNIKAAIEDLENNISFTDFIKKYPKTIVADSILVVNFKYKHKGIEIVEMSEIAINNRSSGSIKFSPKEVHKNSNSIFHKYYPKGDYSKESISGFYMFSKFKNTELPEKYARMIHYTGCLIDTTSVKIKEDAKIGRVDLPKNYETFSFTKKAKLLDKFRSTKVYGQCSMDSSPRVHAANIAKLSAETTNWEVFLKAHLDIMNDRFSRISDGSYAQPGRETYIRELEELNIDVKDLILGICLRIENPNKNHYYGSISRVGRALSETKNSDAIENEIISMIKDKNLDDYNKTLAYFLFKNYNHYIKDESRKQKNETNLKEAISTLPNYLKTKMLDES